MTYSLVSMPILGFDLCRLPAGPQVADVLLAVLQLDSARLAQAAAHHPGVAHRVRWRQVTAATAPSRPLVTELRTITGTEYGLTQARDLVRSLEQNLIGTLDALVRFVRDDVLDWTWQVDGTVRVQDPTAAAAIDVIAGALAAGYSRELLPADLTAALAAPWAAARCYPDPGDLGPFAVTVQQVLDRLTSVDEAQRDGLRRAALRPVTPPEWSEAAHDATWAVYLTGRLRPAAAAQLLAVKAFRGAGFTPRDAAYGVWNLVSGVVQSVVVGDLLDVAVAEVLRRPWLTVFADL